MARYGHPEPLQSLGSMAPDIVQQNLQGTDMLLARIAYQLEQQTAELKEIRRATASCNQHLSIVRRGVQQLVTLATITAEACCRIAITAAEFLNTAATAQSVHRLQLAISSGRLLMLALLLFLCILTSSRTVHQQCAGRLLRSSSPLAWLLAPAAVLQYMQQFTQQPKQKHTGFLGLVKGSYSWCFLTTAGFYALGASILLAWTWHSWTHRAPSQQPAPPTTTPLDPILVLLLAALPARSSDLPLLAVVLPAAVYQAVLGVAAVAAVSGRWFTWLCLWESWLVCCYYSCSRVQNRGIQASNRMIIEHHHHHAQHGQQLHQMQSTAAYPMVSYHMESMLNGSHQQQQDLLHRSSRQWQLCHFRYSSVEHRDGVQQSAIPKASSAAGVGSNEFRLQLALTAVQLVLPAVMAVVAVWR